MNTEYKRTRPTTEVALFISNQTRETDMEQFDKDLCPTIRCDTD